MENKVVIKLVLIGGENTGKTKFIKCYINGDIYLNTYRPSLAAQFYTKIIYFHKQKVRLDIWETAGKESQDAFIRIFAKKKRLNFCFI